MIKTFKLGMEGNFLNILKVIYEKPTPNIILIGEKLKAFPLKQEQDKDALIFATCIKQSNSARKKIKSLQIVNKKSKTISVHI